LLNLPTHQRAVVAFFGHWLLFPSFSSPVLVPFFCLSLLTLTYGSFNPKKAPNSRDEPVLSVHITAISRAGMSGLFFTFSSSLFGLTENFTKNTSFRQFRDS